MYVVGSGGLSPSLVPAFKIPPCKDDRTAGEYRGVLRESGGFWLADDEVDAESEDVELREEGRVRTFFFESEAARPGGRG